MNIAPDSRATDSRATDSRATDSLETVLAAAYTEEVELYLRAVALCQPSAAAPPDACDAWLPGLLELFEQVAAIERRVADARGEWQRRGHPPGPALRHGLARIAELLQILGAAVDAAIGTTEARRARLLPRLDTFVRVRRMQDAYRKSQPRGSELPASPHANDARQ